MHPASCALKSLLLVYGPFHKQLLCAEALYSGVPMVCCPIIAEQPNNSQQLQHLGAGVHVELQLPIQPQRFALQLGSALCTVLASPQYQARARHLGMLLRAQRWTPAEKAAGVCLLS